MLTLKFTCTNVGATHEHKKTAVFLFRSRDYITAVVLPLSRWVLCAFPARFTFRETPANFTSAKSRATSSSKRTTRRDGSRTLEIPLPSNVDLSSAKCRLDSIVDWRQIQFTPEGSEVGRTLILIPIGRVFALSQTLFVLFWQDMRRNFSRASSRINIARIGVRRVVYPRCIHFATCHVAATVTPPHLLIVAMDTSASFPRNFLTYASRIGELAQILTISWSPAIRRDPRMRHFRFNPACNSGIAAWARARARARKQTGRSLASTRICFSRKRSPCRPRRFLNDNEGHLRNAARDRNFRSTRSFASDALKSNQRHQIRLTPATAAARLRRDRDVRMLGTLTASSRASHGSRSISVAPAARIVARTSLSPSFSWTEVRLARTLCDRTPLLHIPCSVPNFIENPYLRFFLRSVKSKIVLRLIHVMYVWMKYIFFLRYEGSRNTFPEFFDILC